MAIKYSIPRANSAALEQSGAFRPEWYNYLRSILSDAVNDQDFDALVARVQALEEGQSQTFIISGFGSILVSGTPEGGIVQITLQNDVIDPGIGWFYGTIDDGTKQWRQISLDTLTDVDLTTPPTDGQTLVWDAMSGTFIPGASAGGQIFNRIDGNGDIRIDGNFDLRITS